MLDNIGSILCVKSLFISSQPNYLFPKLPAWQINVIIIDRVNEGSLIVREIKPSYKMC